MFAHKANGGVVEAVRRFRHDQGVFDARLDLLLAHSG
jgi:hypothetical protein